MTTHSLSQSRRRATALLLAISLCWLVLLVLSRFYHTAWLEMLIAATEAGMVGGLADWYAITVLFRDPFPRAVPLPRLIRDHTAIIPRNQSRIANSMARFVQENFLAPAVVRQTFAERDLLRPAAQWLAQPSQSQQVVEEVTRLLPRLFQLADIPALNQFAQHLVRDWLTATRLNQPIGRILEALFADKAHHPVLQLILDQLGLWISRHPTEARDMIQRFLDDTGVMGLVTRGLSSLLGIDLRDKAVAGVLKVLEQVRAEPQHPLRVHLDQAVAEWAMALLQDDSQESAQLEAFKNQLMMHPAVAAFVSQAVTSLRESVLSDLSAPDSALKRNLTEQLQRFGQRLEEDDAARRALSHELGELAADLAERHSQVAVAYVRDQIEAWDSQMIIDKIEAEAGSDLHMIRINGVLVGSMIGLLLGGIKLALT